MNARCAALLLAALATSGCTTGAWRDRGHDLAQVFDVSFSFGPGMAANVRVTELAQLGFGDFDGHSGGVIDGRFAGIREQRAELGLSLLHTYEYRRTGSEALLDVRQPHFADPGFEAHPLSWQMETDRNDADVGLGVHVAYVGASAAFHFD